jgi:hypothetical protein
VADEATATYRLLIELDGGSRPESSLVASTVDRRLGELNTEYHGKRASGRLRPLSVAWLRRGAAEAHKRACVSAGQREGQFKPAVLQYLRDLHVAFEDFLIP